MAESEERQPQSLRFSREAELAPPVVTQDTEHPQLG
jgi:hypothetical protein